MIFLLAPPKYNDTAVRIKNNSDGNVLFSGSPDAM
jgi:hypothetical protein